MDNKIHRGFVNGDLYGVTYPGITYTDGDIEHPDDDPELVYLVQLANNQEQIKILKKFLADTDYAITKIAEGVSTKEEYAEVIQQRQEARAKINELEE